MDRRSFMSLLAAAAVGGVPIARAEKPNCLVLIELQGGNDGLNTVVPYADILYKKLRPKLSIEPDSLVKLNEGAALHPALEPLHAAWGGSQLAIVQGLGYENPNRSHFRSHDIWASASGADRRKESGWIADSMSMAGSGVQAIVLGERASVFQGGSSNYVSMRRVNDFITAKLPARAPLARTANEAQMHAHSVLESTHAFRAKLRESSGDLKKGSVSAGNYGGSLFAKQLRDTALLIKAGLAPRVVTLHINGFDTHANQLERQADRLSRLADGLSAFREELIFSGHWNDTLVATWSEFGRRPAENDSVGTDHGTAAPQFVLGGRVRGGLYGQQPSLSDLQNSDLVHTVDFRQLYSSITKHWWGMGDSSIDSRRFPALDILKT